ncbi:hypothetical protein FB45DRAFT_864669 [Roridomyces roridus]|uniref:Uncharacterized protein n=1 Tax=Roridomyces roridus TaxID=1738132 RepID=A0AAD7C1R9_9AGAR|nr:hypothetical protein FB45DRAFT_864669 [Roridomyces roridus]
MERRSGLWSPVDRIRREKADMSGVSGLHRYTRKAQTCAAAKYLTELQTSAAVPRNGIGRMIIHLAAVPSSARASTPAPRRPNANSSHVQRSPRTDAAYRPLFGTVAAIYRPPRDGSNCHVGLALLIALDRAEVGIGLGAEVPTSIEDLVPDPTCDGSPLSAREKCILLSMDRYSRSNLGLLNCVPIDSRNPQSYSICADVTPHLVEDDESDTKLAAPTPYPDTPVLSHAPTSTSTNALSMPHPTFITPRLTGSCAQLQRRSTYVAGLGKIYPTLVRAPPPVDEDSERCCIAAVGSNPDAQLNRDETASN